MGAEVEYFLLEREMRWAMDRQRRTKCVYYNEDCRMKRSFPLLVPHPTTYWTRSVYRHSFAKPEKKIIRIRPRSAPPLKTPPPQYRERSKEILSSVLGDKYADNHQGNGDASLKKVHYADVLEQILRRYKKIKHKEDDGEAKSKFWTRNLRDKLCQKYNEEKSDSHKLPQHSANLTNQSDVDKKYLSIWRVHKFEDVEKRKPVYSEQTAVHRKVSRSAPPKLVRFNTMHEIPL